MALLARHPLNIFLPSLYSKVLINQWNWLKEKLLGVQDLWAKYIQMKIGLTKRIIHNFLVMSERREENISFSLLYP